MSFSVNGHSSLCHLFEITPENELKETFRKVLGRVQVTVGETNLRRMSNDINEKEFIHFDDFFQNEEINSRTCDKFISAMLKFYSVADHFLYELKIEKAVWNILLEHKKWLADHSRYGDIDKNGLYLINMKDDTVYRLFCIYNRFSNTNGLDRYRVTASNSSSRRLNQQPRSSANRRRITQNGGRSHERVANGDQLYLRENELNERLLINQNGNMTPDEEADFLEMDFEPNESEDSDDSGDSGRGADETTDGNDAAEDLDEFVHDHGFGAASYVLGDSSSIASHSTHVNHDPNELTGASAMLIDVVSLDSRLFAILERSSLISMNIRSKHLSIYCCC